MSNKCIMKTLHFDLEVSIYQDMFQAAGYEDNDEGHIKLIEDLMKLKFKTFIFDGIFIDSPPFEIELIEKSVSFEDEKWEEV